MAGLSMFLSTLLIMSSITLSIDGFSECWACVMAGHMSLMISQLLLVAIFLFPLPSITYKEPFKKENNSTFITQYLSLYSCFSNQTIYQSYSTYRIKQ